MSSPARRTIDALRKLRKGVINQAHPDDFTHALLDYTIRLHEAAEAEQKYYRRFPRPTHPWVLIDDLRAALDADIAGLHGPANTTRQVRPATARRGGLRP